MPLARRVACLAIASLFSAVVLIAQPTGEPTDAILNWTAPPFWTPPSLAALERAKSESVLPLESEAIEGLPTSPLPFFGIRPCRVVDTRPSQGFTGAYGPPILAANATRDFDLNNAPHCPGIPANAEAYSINVTITETAGPGDVRIWPTGNPPTIPVSTQNWPSAGYTLANAAIVPAGTSGSVTVQIAGSDTHFIIDINGYYAPIAIVNTVNGLSGAVTLAAGSNVTIFPAGNTLIFSASGSAPGWSLTGNAGTTPGTNFVGTTDNQPLEIKVNNQRIFRLEPNATSPRVIGGHADNNALAGVFGATIGGGGAAGFGNAVTDVYGTVGGGRGNRAGDNQGTVFDHAFATVSGGLSNIASGHEAVVGGGNGNLASGQTSTVGGGFNNNASGQLATIPGGNQNTAAGMGSFAAGKFAQANHDGAFVWGDNSSAFAVSSTGINQFIVRANGGIWLGTTTSPSLDISTNFLTTSTGARLTIGGTWTNSSDAASKENFEEIDRRDLLERLATLPIARWTYKAEKCSVRHLGPTGQDFAAAFGLGGDDRSIATVDADGVALAAIQALYEEVQELRKRVAELEAAKD